MSESKTFLLSEEVMQKLSDADSALADVALAAMLSNDVDTFEKVVGLGLSIFEFQHDAVEAGLAERVMDRSDREEPAND
jgi:hypothetical protein